MCTPTKLKGASPVASVRTLDRFTRLPTRFAAVRSPGDTAKPCECVACALLMSVCPKQKSGQRTGKPRDAGRSIREDKGGGAPTRSRLMCICGPHVFCSEKVALGRTQLRQRLRRPEGELSGVLRGLWLLKVCGVQPMLAAGIGPKPGCGRCVSFGEVANEKSPHLQG